MELNMLIKILYITISVMGKLSVKEYQEKLQYSMYWN